MKKLKIIDNGSGFECTGCHFEKVEGGCKLDAFEELKVGDCGLNTVFVEVEVMLMPNEECEEIQEILKADCDLQTKSARIESYYKSFIPRNRNRQAKQKTPEWSYMRIWSELLKRGDDLTPIEV